jgi:hypothetical protein
MCHIIIHFLTETLNGLEINVICNLLSNYPTYRVNDGIQGDIERAIDFKIEKNIMIIFGIVLMVW